jgi:lipoate---protein ligase
MILIRPGFSSDPAINLALEQHCIESEAVGATILLLYINRPSVVIGRHQVPAGEFDPAFAKGNGISLVRRLSGGGAVFHDHGNLNFAFISPHDRTRFLNFHRALAPMVSALRTLGVPAEFAAPNSIAADGKKISGTSQYSNLRRMMTHGTLLFDTDLVRLERVLVPKRVPVESSGVPSIRRPVGNIAGFVEPPATLDRFADRLIESLAKGVGGLEPLSLGGSERERIESIADEKFRSWEWTYGRTPRFSVVRGVRTGKDRFRMRLTVDRGRVESVGPERGEMGPDRLERVRGKLTGRRYDTLFFDD